MLAEEETKQTRVNWVFLLQWVIVTIATIPALIFTAGFLSQPQVLMINTAGRVVVVGVAVGIVTGSLQWAVLQSHLPQAAWWILATIDGFGAGFLMSYAAIRIILYTVFARFHYDYLELVKHPAGLLSFITVIALAIAPPGILQWLILRKQVPKAGWWLLAWLLGVTGSLGIFLMTGLISPGGVVSVTSVVLMIIGAGTILAVITGVSLLVLLNQKRKLTEQASMLPISRRTVIALIIGLITTLAIDLTIVLVLSRPALIFSERFEENEQNKRYLTSPAFSIKQGRLRITIDQSFTGVAVALPNQYDDFTFLTSLFPVGEPHDGSANLILRYSSAGWYEIQFRPGQQQIHVMKVVKRGDQETQLDITDGWINTPDLELKTIGNELKVTAQGNAFTLWFNGKEIIQFEDNDEIIYTRGAINIGAGAAETANIAYEYDDIRIWNP